MGGNVSFLDAAKAAKRMAERSGVTVDVVFAKFRQGVQKSALSYTDFFWGNSDISLRHKKVNQRSSAARLPRACGVASRKLGV